MVIHSMNERLAEADAAFASKQFQKASKLRNAIQQDIKELTSCRQHGLAIANGAPCQASVIVLSYQDDDLISEALTRIASQVREDFEVILASNANPNLERRGQEVFAHFKFVDIPVNVGASIGRNIAVLHAIGKRIIFLEDDGLIEPGCIDALLQCSEETGAVVVRGRVRLLNEATSFEPPHYDLGDYRRMSFMTCEGVACVLREDFVLVGGFDPVLATHEGIELCGRLWRFFGPRGFVYEPQAILLHDFAFSDADRLAKRRRQEACDEYIKWASPNTIRLHLALKLTVNLPESIAATQLIESTADLSMAPSSAPKISVITTAKNGEEWLDDYFRCWRKQTYANYEVIFVDDGSEDDTLIQAQRIADVDKRFIVIRGDGQGRSAALNTAIEHATGDIFAIADVDDISAPDRLELTAKYFRGNVDVEVLSFAVYGEDHLNWIGGRPNDNRFGDFGARSLIGMPGRFPTYAFRKAFCRERFDPNLAAGVDYDWVSRNLAASASSSIGQSLPIPVAYYRQHERSITNSRAKAQLGVRVATIQANFERLLGSVSETDRIYIDALSKNTIKDPRFDVAEYRGWVTHLLRLNEEKKCFNPRALEYALIESFYPTQTAGQPARTKGFQTKMVPSLVDPYDTAKQAMSQIQEARKNGYPVRSIKMLRQLRAGLRGIVVESIQAEFARFIRKLRNGLKAALRFLNTRQ